MLYSSLKRALLFGTSAILAAAVFVGASVAPAAAEPVLVTGQRVIAPEGPTQVVQFGDLNIATQLGEKRLLRRVSHAVDAVCPSFELSRIMTSEERSCRDFAWSGARSQIATALASARNGEMNALAAAIRVSAR